MNKVLNSRERVKLALKHEEADRVAIHDSPWGTTIARWRKEGMPEVSPAEFFNYELVFISADLSLRLQPVKIEETNEYIISRDANGRTLKNWKNRTSTQC